MADLDDVLRDATPAELARIASSGAYGSATRAKAAALLAERGVAVDPDAWRTAPAAAASPAGAPRRWVGRGVAAAITALAAVGGILVLVGWLRGDRPRGRAVEVAGRAERRAAVPAPLAPPGADEESRAAYAACQRLDLASCVRLAIGNLEGGDRPEAAARAFELFAFACAQGSAEACGEVGVSYARGRGVEPDPAMARTYLGLACDLGFAAACDPGGGAPR